MHSLLETYLSEVASHLRSLPTERRAEELREMRAHLESASAALREGGATGAGAASAVLEQFGGSEAIARGLWGAWRRGENKRKRVVMKERIIFGSSLAAVTLGAAWLVFVAAMIGRVLRPQGQILIHASEGASLKVQQGIVQVLSAGSNGTGVETFNVPLLAACISVPFLLIVGFAVVGCCSMLRARRLA